MATAKRPAFTKVTTPKGALIWPKLAAPDEYKGKKTYSAKIRLNEADSQALIEKIEAELRAYWPIAKAELEEKVANAKTGKQKAEAKKALDEMKEADKSYKPAYDDDGNETGEYEFNFKMPDHFMGKDDKPVYIKPDVFDAKQRLLKVVPEVWGGTVARVVYLPDAPPPTRWMVLYNDGVLLPLHEQVTQGRAIRVGLTERVDMMQGRVVPTQYETDE